MNDYCEPTSEHVGGIGTSAHAKGKPQVIRRILASRSPKAPPYSLAPQISFSLHFAAYLALETKPRGYLARSNKEA